MKGLDLPVNTLVIIIVCVLVLLAVIVLFLGGWTGVGVIDKSTALGKACLTVTNNGCKTDALDKNVCADILCRKKVDLDNNGSPDTVMEICNANGITDSNGCLSRCGCLT